MTQGAGVHACVPGAQQVRFAPVVIAIGALVLHPGTLLWWCACAARAHCYSGYSVVHQRGGLPRAVHRGAGQPRCHGACKRAVWEVRYPWVVVTHSHSLCTAPLHTPPFPLPCASQNTRLDDKVVALGTRSNVLRPLQDVRNLVSVSGPCKPHSTAQGQHNLVWVSRGWAGFPWLCVHSAACSRAGFPLCLLPCVPCVCESGVRCVGGESRSSQ